MSDNRPVPPPVKEQIHLPGPSVKPALAALALTLVVLGVVSKLYLTVAGVILLVYVAWLWIADTRKDIRELPHD